MQMTLMTVMIFPRMSLHCKLVPVHYRQYEYGQLCGLDLLLKADFNIIAAITTIAAKKFNARCDHIKTTLHRLIVAITIVEMDF